MSSYSPFKLSAQLIAHSQDVKALTSSSPDSIFSSSRDTTIINWQRASPSLFSSEKKFSEHSHFVNSLSFIKPSAKYPSGLLVSGSSDKTINVYDLTSPGTEPIYSLLGHTDNVNTLAVDDSNPESPVIISGSWDKTVKIWKNFQCSNTLTGHSLAIWGVLSFGEGKYLSSSADKTIRLWNDDAKVIYTFIGHTDVVRGLAKVGFNQFLSCSNDCTIRLWNLTGDCVAELVGHTSFVYSVAVLPTGEFVSSAEDRSVKIWNATECKQTINHPCTSVWCVDTLENGDIVSGGSDGVVRVFSRASERFTDEDNLKAFDNEVAKFAIPAQQVGKIDKSKLSSPEALNRPGKKDQQTIMVEVDGVIEAHQWHEAERNWIKVGEVVNSAGTGGNAKAMFEGKEYDYVFDVDFGTEGQGAMLKLPYNLSDNPYAAAQQFIYRNDLNQDYLDTIANFIIRNTEGQVIGSSVGSGYADPFTGGGRYVPPVSQGSSSSVGGFGGDPFTSGGRYVPPTSTSAPSNATTVSPPPAKLNATYTFFSTGNTTAIVNKIMQLNEQISKDMETSSVGLNEKEVESLKKIGSLLQNPTAASFSNQFKEEDVDLLLKISIQWPASSRFPGIDLLRLCILHSSLPISMNDSVIFDLISEIGQFEQINATNSVPKELEACVMLTLRLVANMFSQEIGKHGMKQHRQQIFETVKGVVGSGNKNLRVAFVTLMLNYSILVSDKSDGEFAAEILKILVEFIKSENEQDSLHKGFTAIGVLVKTYGTDLKEIAKLVGVDGIVVKSEGGADGKLKAVLKTVLDLLK
ncbi:hypothetical protein HK098_007253 [Nowakowskiella sp. JEL0407]|nr:hypothetical protein HK098_007253 [Nowakowskiella sp. JEL0407]